MPTYNTNIQTANTNAGGSGDLLSFDGDWLTTDHTGVVFRIRDEGNARYCYCQIVQVITTRLCRVTWDGNALPVGSSSALWEEQAFSPARGYPRSVCIHDQRLVFGGTRDAGSVLMFSKPGQLRNFDLGDAADGDAIIVQAAGAVSNIRHLLSATHLTIFSERGVSYVPFDATKPLTPTSIKSRRGASYGAGNVAPLDFDDGVLMAQRGGDGTQGLVIRDVIYSSESENLAAQPVNLTAAGWLGPVVDAAALPASNERPEQLAIFVTDDGRIGCYHSVRSQKIAAWFEWTTTGKWTSVCTAGQKLWGIVNREGLTYDLEVFDRDVPFDAAVPWTAVGGASLPCAHIGVGRTVYAVDDTMSYLGDGVVAAGAVTVTSQIGAVPSLGSGAGYVGRAFGWWIKMLPPAIDLPDGTTINRPQRVIRTSIQLLNAYTGEHDATDLGVRLDGGVLQQDPGPQRGWWSVTNIGWSRRDEPLQPNITRRIPMPVGVLSVIREVRV